MSINLFPNYLLLLASSWNIYFLNQAQGKEAKILTLFLKTFLYITKYNWVTDICQAIFITQ